MLKNLCIKQMVENAVYTGVCLITGITFQETKKGSSYLQAILRDKDGDTLSVKKWDTDPGDDIPKEGSLVNVVSDVLYAIVDPRIRRGGKTS